MAKPIDIDEIFAPCLAIPAGLDEYTVAELRELIPDGVSSFPSSLRKSEIKEKLLSLKARALQFCNCHRDELSRFSPGMIVRREKPDRNVAELYILVGAEISFGLDYEGEFDLLIQLCETSLSLVDNDESGKLHLRAYPVSWVGLFSGKFCPVKPIFRNAKWMSTLKPLLQSLVSQLPDA